MGTEKNDCKVFGLAKKVYHKLIGSDLIPIKDDFQSDFATSDYEYPKWHFSSGGVWIDTRNKDENKAVTEKQLERVKEIVGENIKLDGKDIFWTKNGKIAISTPDCTWKMLCGRLWHVDLDSGTYKLVSMS